MRLAIDADPGIFYSIGNGYALFPNYMKAGEIEIGPRILLNCMFQGYQLFRKEVRVGYYFETQFKSSNHGGYIVTYLNNKGPATSVEILLKTKELVICNYPNRGTLIISPTVNERVQVIFSEQ